MDWERLARNFETATDARNHETTDDLSALFAPGGTYEDPVNPPTNDFDELHTQTQSSTPDWHCEVVSICGDQNRGSFEWIGRATLFGVTQIEVPGCAFIEVNQEGLVTRWRDYFDIAGIANQAASSGQALGGA